VETFPNGGKFEGKGVRTCLDRSRCEGYFKKGKTILRFFFFFFFLLYVLVFFLSLSLMFVGFLSFLLVG
jgi:hypothetical protein